MPAVSDIESRNSQPAWLTNEQMRWAWVSWEPLMMYRRHGGQFETFEAASHWIGDWFNRIHTEEYICKLRDAGFNCITTHFHKGFGMAAEAEEMEMTRGLIKVAHKHGIRVLVYVQSMSIMYETFLKEVPEAEDWLGVAENGQPHAYSEQYWRLFPCFNKDGYITYVNKVIEKAITWAEADGVWLDNTNFSACQCEACQKKFLEYLRWRYPSPDVERFGISSFDDVRIPIKARTYDPIYQESLRFRCEVLNAFVNQSRKLVRSLNPDAVVAANFGTPSPYNVTEVLGVDPSTSARTADIVLAENGNFPELDKEVMISQIRAYKAGHATGSVVVPSHWRIEECEYGVATKMPETVAHVKLDLAESAAFGRGCVGSTWAVRPSEMGRSTFFEREDIFNAVKEYNTFFAKNEALYTGSTSLANVAVYRNFPSIAFAHDIANDSLGGYEQVLIQNQIPFDAVFEEDIDRLGDYDVLILPNVLCMSDNEIEQIRDYVKRGKALVATGQSSLYDENYRQRRDYGLSDLFGTSYKHEIKNPAPVFINSRVLFTPGTPEKVSCNYLNYQTRVALPSKNLKLVEYIRQVCPGGFPVEVDSTPHVAVEICQTSRGVVVHMINYDNTKPVTGVKLTFSPEICNDNKVELISVDHGGEVQSLALESCQDSRHTVCIPLLETYSLVLLSR